VTTSFDSIRAGDRAWAVAAVLAKEAGAPAVAPGARPARGGGSSNDDRRVLSRA
jgi:hypothetical protein